MPSLSNSPSQETLLRLEARKSESINIRFRRKILRELHLLNITGASIRFVMAEQEQHGGAVVINQLCELVSEDLGYARLNLQAATLDLPSREYDFVVTMTNSEHYSGVVLKGTVEILSNPDLLKTNVYDDVDAPSTLQVTLTGQTIHVIVDHLPDPGSDGADGEQGPQGEQGEQGPQGEEGPQGPPGNDGADGTDGADGSKNPIQPYSYGGVVAAGAQTMRLYVNEACTIASVRASVGTAPTGSALVVDVLKNGVTIFTGGTDRPSIAAGTFTDTGVPAVTSLAPGDYLTITVVSVGSTVPGSDLCVQVVAA